MSLSRRTLLLLPLVRLFPQEPRFSGGVDVVTVLATVRDRDGRIVKGLNREDFVLDVDGAPGDIRYFSRESDLPLTIGLLVDTSESQTVVLESERRASYVFLDRVLRGADQAFVAHFDVRVEVLQGFTSSRNDLSAALDQLRIPSRISTLLYDAVRDCSDNQMRRKEGRKAFILLSDGVDYHSKTTLETAIESAQRADTSIYSILFADPLNPARPIRAAILGAARTRGKKVMRRLAGETGGAYFEVTSQQPLEAIYAQIEDALRNQYSLGFTPDHPSPAGQYHQIRLSTKKPGLVVQTRQGYYSK
jgi:VWFA-related protein